METVATTQKTNLPSTEVAMWEGDNLGDNKPAYPNLLIMQAASKLVAQGVANTGEIVDGASKEVILKKGASLEFFPIMLNSEWYVFRKIDPQDKDRWVKCEKLSIPPQGAGTKWSTPERQENGIWTKEGRSLRVFIGVIGKLSDDSFPYMIILRGMSTSAAISLIHHVEKKTAQKKPYADTIFKMMVTAKELNGKMHQSVEFTPSRAATKEELAVAFKWRESLLKMRDQVINQNTDDEEAPF